MKGSGKLKIGFVGAGKVGTNLARYFADKGLTISGFFIRTDTSDSKLSGDDFKKIIKNSDVVFITVSDDEIMNVVEKILKENIDLNLKSFAHTSGSYPLDVLFPLKEKGADIFTFHPLQSFSSKNIADSDLETMHIFIENIESEKLNEILMKINNPYHEIKSNHKSQYHLAASIISNLTTGLIDFGFDLLEEIGIDKKMALDAFEPLIVGTVNSIVKKGPSLALTGPVTRGDSETVIKHLSCLEGDDRELYRILANKTLLMSKEKISAEQYHKLSNILKR